MIAIAALLIAMLLAISASGVVPGKGTNSYLVAGTISGPGIATPVRFDLDGSYDYFIPLHTPHITDFRLPPHQLTKLKARRMPYELTFHYDYGRYPGRLPGAVDLHARFDGYSLLYFDNSKSGLAYGWFEASERLTKRLRIEKTWAQLPSTLGTFKPEPFSTQFKRIVIAFSIAIAVVSALYLRGQKPSNAPAWHIAERLASRELPLGPGVLQ